MKTLTLDSIEVAAPREACDVLKWGGTRAPSQLTRLAIRVVSQEIVNCGSMPLPLAVSLRFESDEETAARLLCEPRAARAGA
jgi:hypothetical protein